MLGFALDPNFTINPYMYVLYTYNLTIGGTPPTWGDGCPSPARRDDGRMRGQRTPLADYR